MSFYIMRPSLKNKIIAAVVGLLLSSLCHAQKEMDRLQAPPEYTEVGQKLYEGFEFMFAQVSKYARSNAHITKAGMDSVRQDAMKKYFELYPQVQEALSEKSSSEAIVQPQVQKLMDEALSVINQPNKKLETLADQLGKINQKAAQTLSEEEAAIIYSTTCVAYYSTKYWTTSFPKWEKLKETVAKKNRK